MRPRPHEMLEIFSVSAMAVVVFLHFTSSHLRLVIPAATEFLTSGEVR